MSRFHVAAFIGACLLAIGINDAGEYLVPSSPNYALSQSFFWVVPFTGFRAPGYVGLIILALVFAFYFGFGSLLIWWGLGK